MYNISIPPLAGWKQWPKTSGVLSRLPFSPSHAAFTVLLWGLTSFILLVDISHHKKPKDYLSSLQSPPYIQLPNLWNLSMDSLTPARHPPAPDYSPQLLKPFDWVSGSHCCLQNPLYPQPLLDVLFLSPCCSFSVTAFQFLTVRFFFLNLMVFCFLKSAFSEAYSPNYAWVLSRVLLFVTLWQEYWSRLPFPPSGGSSWPRDWTWVSCSSCIGRQISYHWAWPGFDPWVKRSPGEGNDYSLQYSGLESSMDRGAWQATVCRFTKSQTLLSLMYIFMTITFKSLLVYLSPYH